MSEDFQDSWENNPTVEDPVWARDGVDFHETGELVDGTPVGKVGAIWYVLDDDGDAISKGYHQIRVSEDGLVGKKGSITEPVEFMA